MAKEPACSPDSSTTDSSLNSETTKFQQNPYSSPPFHMSNTVERLTKGQTALYIVLNTSGVICAMKIMNALLHQYFTSASVFYSVIFQWGPMLFWSSLTLYGQNQLKQSLKHRILCSTE